MCDASGITSWYGGPMPSGGTFFARMEPFEQQMLEVGRLYQPAFDEYGDVAALALQGDSADVAVLEIRREADGSPRIITDGGDNVVFAEPAFAKLSADRMGLKWRREGGAVLAARPPRHLRLHGVLPFNAGDTISAGNSCHEIVTPVYYVCGGFGPLPKKLKRFPHGCLCG